MLAKVKCFILFTLLIGLNSIDAKARQTSMPKDGLTPKGDSLVGKWYLVPVLPGDTSTGRIPEIEFDIKEYRFAGNTGCNRMAGSFVVTDSSFHFGSNMITTRMFCAGYNEDAFLKNMLRINRYKFENGQLILLVDDEEVFRWSRQISRPKSTLKA